MPLVYDVNSGAKANANALVVLIATSILTGGSAHHCLPAIFCTDL